MERNRGELSVLLTRVVDGVGKAVDDVRAVVEDDGVDTRGRDEPPQIENQPWTYIFGGFDEQPACGFQEVFES